MKDRIYNWLRKSEKFFKTDMLYAVINGFWLSVGQILSIGIVFISAVVFGYFLPKEVYGEYKFILSAVSILASLSLAGMGMVVVQATAQGKEGVFRDAVKTSLRWGVIVWAIALVIAAYYVFNGSYSLAISILIAGLCTPFISSFGLSTSLFAGRRDFKRSTLYAIGIQILTTLFLIITAISIQSAVLLVVVNFLLTLLLNFWMYRKVMRKHEPIGPTDPDMISYGKHVSYMNFFGTLANQLDKILVFHWLGAANLAVYAFAIAIPEQIKGSYKNLFSIALPKMSSASTDISLLRSGVVDKFYRLTLITILAVLAYYFLAPFIYIVFFPKYIDAVWYSQIYILGLIAVPGISLFGSYFQVRQDTKTLYKLTIIGNLSTIILTSILIYNYGILGAVIENGLSWLVMLLVNLFYFVRSK